MSYILDALKKSDQLRKRGAAPTLQAAQPAPALPKQPPVIYYGLFAAILFCGIAIGWMRPWQSATDSSAANVPLQPAARAALAEMPAMAIAETAPKKMTRMVTQAWPAPDSKPAVQAGPKADAMKSDAPARTGAPMPEKPAGNADVAQEQRAIPWDELPIQIQQEIPALTVQLHAYSSTPKERLVSVNSIMLREGESLMPGLRLEQITPDGLIFSYKGYRFQHGIR